MDWARAVFTLLKAAMSAAISSCNCKAGLSTVL
jgi:hypothetical protein